MTERRILIASLIIFVFCISVIPLAVVADHHNDEDWFDGPGEVNTDNRHGLDRKVYLQLWNLDEDRNLSEPIYEVDENDGETSWKDMANLAAEIDFSSYDYPGNNAIQKWNSGAKTDFETELENTESITYVPPERIDDLKSGNIIKDAYISIYSIDPSLNMIDENASPQNNNYTTIRSDGKIVTSIDYRVDEPTGVETSDRRVEYEKEKDPTIEYHKLSYYPNCSEGSGCIMDKNEDDGHVSTLEFNNLDRREHTLYVEGQVETKWKKTVYTCQEDFGPVTPPGEDNSTDDNTTDGNDTDTESLNPVQRVKSKSINRGSPNSCENWVMLGESIITDKVTFDTEFDVKVEGDIFGRVQYAELPNSYQVKINFGKRWTHAELPGGAKVESGWRIFASRNPTYTYLEGIYSGTHDRYLTTNDPPVQANMYPDENGVKAYYDGEDDGGAYSPVRIIYTDGERTKIPKLPKNALYETPDDQFPETEQKEFIDVDEVILEINKNSFNPNGGVTLNGVMKNSEKTLNDDVRQVKKSNITVEINEFYKDNSTANITVSLIGPDGEPINTQNRDGYIEIYDKKFNTSASGQLTTMIEVENTLNKPKIKYIPKNWWEMDENTQAYVGDETQFSPAPGHDLWGMFAWITPRIMVLWGAFVIFRKGLLNSLGIDIKPPIEYAIGEVKRALFSVFELIK